MTISQYTFKHYVHLLQLTAPAVLSHCWICNMDQSLM